MSKWNILLFVLIALFWSTSVAYSLPYSPGNLGIVGPPLADFASSNTVDACKLLSAREFDSARPIFENELKQSPWDLTAFVGYVQCSQADWPKLYNQYKSQDQQYPSPVNDFKFSLLARYSNLSPKNGFKSTLKTLNALVKQKLSGNSQDGQDGFESAFNSTHSPVVAFVTGNPRYLEAILHQYAGNQATQMYMDAKNSGWTTPIPTVKMSSSRDLNILTWIIGYLRFPHELVSLHPDPSQDHKDKVIRLVPDPYTTDQTAAINWLNTWDSRVKAQIISQGGTLDKRSQPK